MLSRSTDCGHIDEAFKFRSDWKNHRPLGITCAAVARGTAKHHHTQFWQMPGRFDRDLSVGLVYDLMNLADVGDMIVTFNGLSFDFNVLAEESGMYKECAELALNHVDLMFIVVTLRGHFLGLDKAAKGANIQGKLHDVTLSDGDRKRVG